MSLPKEEKHMASEPENSTLERSTCFYIFLYTSSRKRGIGPSAQSYIRDTDVTRAISLSSADVRMTVFMSFCIRTNSFIVWAVNPPISSDNLTVRVIPFILSSVLQSNFSLATSIAIHHYYEISVKLPHARLWNFINESNVSCWLRSSFKMPTEHQDSLVSLSIH